MKPELRLLAACSIAQLVASVTGCSTMLDYDALAFDGDASAPDASAGTGGSGKDASWEGKGGTTGWGGGPQSGGAGGTAGAGGTGTGGASQGGSSQGGAGGAPPTCNGIDCGPNGKCIIDGVAKCQCNAGYHPVGYSCVEDPNCNGVSCSSHGTCILYGGKPTCQCDSGYHAQGTECVANTPDTACQGIDCGGHGACLSDPITGVICHCEVGYFLSYSNTNCQPATGTQCDGVSCGGFGTCLINGMFSTCGCDPGYTTYGQYCVLEKKLGCRDVDNSYQPLGTSRCSADDTHVEVCWDGNNDGLAEWIDGQVTCPAGETCSTCKSHPCLATGYAQECPAGETCVPCPIGSHCVPEAHGQPLYICAAACNCDNCANCQDPANLQDWQEYCGNTGSSPATQACTIPCQPGDGCLPWGANSICWGMEGCFSAPP
jgi:hypothetical protein